VLNTYLPLLPGNIIPLSSSKLRDIIEENSPQHWRTKYENSDLNLVTIPELNGYFTRLKDLDQKRKNHLTNLTKTQTKSIRLKKIELRQEELQGETINPKTRIIPNTASSTNLLHMIHMSLRPRRIMTLSQIVKTIKS
jgi:hypothetical protein